MKFEAETATKRAEDSALGEHRHFFVHRIGWLRDQCIKPGCRLEVSCKDWHGPAHLKDTQSD